VHTSDARKASDAGEAGTLSGMQSPGFEKTGDETIQPNNPAKPEGSGAGHRSGHAGTKAQTMNTTRTPAGGSVPEEEEERPFAPVGEVMRRTELLGTRYPLRIRQELTGDEYEEEGRP